MMDLYHAYNEVGDHGNQTKTRETTIQIILSLALGVSAFLTFCILRPRWSGLYAARNGRKDKTAAPELPTTLFGWILPLWRVTDQQVLASAGLDAYVFLAFFKMAIKFLSITLFFSLAVIKPVHDSYPDEDKPKSGHNKNGTSGDVLLYTQQYKRSIPLNSLHSVAPWMPDYIEIETDYLWMYPVFAYLFSVIALYMLVAETRRIIEVRQEYLGSQTTITDRTIRLSGIPSNLQSEEKIKNFVEELDIGKVESVTLCRNWKELDDLVAHRNTLLRKLEEVYTVFQGFRSVERNLESLPISQPSPPGPAVNEEHDDDETRRALLSPTQHASTAPYSRPRPKATIRFGRFNLRSMSVDAIHYYEEKLRVTDDKIRELREKEFDPTPLAFVTMDSVAACQMASQAVLDPSPLQLLANPSPAPGDVVWPNTYISRRNRMIRAWSITVFIGLLTVFWSVILVPIATALNTDTIRKVFPQLADVLESHPTLKSLVTTQLSTLITSLLNVAVPYLYAWLSDWQGMTSQGDVELSVISKNFFFTFFNFFVVFTILGTASNFLQDIGDSLKDTTKIAYTLAQSLQRLLTFYNNFIILQGVGLFPFRLLEFGAVATYPISLIGAKTPRDYAELVQPPTFSYGFYLPQTILIFIICVVYSVLRGSWMVILSGLIYFLIGSFVYKYQLLYAMDQRHHSTGKAWTMMCDRVIVGIILFQITVGGQLALKKALIRSALLIPLLIGTIWFTYVYAKTYRPLMRFIALRSIRRAEQSDYNMVDDSDNEGQDGDASHQPDIYHGETVDESNENGMRFVNPSLVAPLKPVWIADKSLREENGEGYLDGRQGDGLA